jgi:hypothetical protein
MAARCRSRTSRYANRERTSDGYSGHRVTLKSLGYMKQQRRRMATTSPGPQSPPIGSLATLCEYRPCSIGILAMRELMSTGAVWASSIPPRTRLRDLGGTVGPVGTLVSGAPGTLSVLSPLPHKSSYSGLAITTIILRKRRAGIPSGGKACLKAQSVLGHPDAEHHHTQEPACLGVDRPVVPSAKVT